MRFFSLLSVLLTAVFSSCSTVKPVEPPPATTLAVVGTYAEGTGDVANSHFEGLKKKFEDGTDVSRVELKAEPAAYFLYREGVTAKKDCIISRTPLTTVDGVLGVDLRAAGTETCTGMGCSQCAFKSSGGCECKNSTNTCNHTISRNSGLFL